MSANMLARAKIAGGIRAARAVACPGPSGLKTCAPTFSALNQQEQPWHSIAKPPEFGQEPGKKEPAAPEAAWMMTGEMGQANISEANYALVTNAIIAKDSLASIRRVDPNRSDDGKGESGTPASAFIPRDLACPDLRADVQAKGKREIVLYFAAQEDKLITP